MSHIIIKSDAWCKSEDEILKAAVEKYGKNEWPRIAALLHHKTPEDCETRWYEYLVPNMKKAEMSAKQGEKLLDLRKIMPTHWHNKSERTAAEPLEQYEHENKLNDPQPNEGAENDTCQLKPGEINPSEMEQPSPPGTNDLCRNDLEMLSEAHTHLAATQAKNEKHNELESHLNAARCLADLKKRRELRVAGIETSNRNRMRDIDYNTEASFQRRPALGCYNTPNDIIVKTDFDFNRTQQQDLDDEYHTETEKSEHNVDKVQVKRRKENDISSARLQNFEIQQQRLQLVPLESQNSQQELIEGTRLGRDNKADNEIAMENAMEISPYDDTNPSTSAPHRNRVIQRVQNVTELTNNETSLKNVRNTPLYRSDFLNASPKFNAITTRNRVEATAYRSHRERSTTPIIFSRPPSISQTPRPDEWQTALVDQNKFYVNPEGSVNVRETPDLYKNCQKYVKAPLRERLGTLSPQNNDYNLVVPNENEDQADQADVMARRLFDEKDVKPELKLSKRSQITHYSLSTATEVNTNIMRSSTGRRQNLTELQNAKEMMKHNEISMIRNSLPGQSQNKRKQRQSYFKTNPCEEDEQQEARELLANEMQMYKDSMDLDTYSQVWNERLGHESFVPLQNRCTGTNLTHRKYHFESSDPSLEPNYRYMSRMAKLYRRSEKKLKIRNEGYPTRVQTVIKQLYNACEDIKEYTEEMSAFQYQAEQEVLSISRRLDSLREAIQRQIEGQKELRHKYRVLNEGLASLKVLCKEE